MKKNPYIIIFLVTPFVLWVANILSPGATVSNQFQRFIDVPNIPQGEFKYGGSTTWAQIRKEVDPEIKSALSNNFRLTYIDPPPKETPGSYTGIRMLLENQLDFAVSSHPLTENEKKQGLMEKEVAIDSIAIAVNPKLVLQKQGLTIDELKSIYTAKITNWKQLDGPDEIIKPYTRDPKDGGTVDFFLKEVLKIEVGQLQADFVEDTTRGIREVVSHLGGVYYASSPEIVGQCEIKPLPLGLTAEKFIPPYIPPYLPPKQCHRFQSKVKVNTQELRSGSYPIKRKLYVIIKQDEPTKQQVGEAYANLLLTAEGQQLLEKAGYASLYDTQAN
ncbi:MAG: substrate-binding domain-containing protein [Brasilonema angustatum HA4187-MV1]|jgi:phosphate transport system substrate-binding protein|nr:substrate-binding domain-containing protein [Brasilonema angustatum HA4187-MV1]